MSIGSPLFFLACFVAGIICFHRDRPYWKIGFLAFNFGFVATFFSTVETILPLALFCISGFVAIRISERYRGIAALWAIILALLILFIFLKKYEITGSQAAFEFDYPTIGLSYILFRILHLVIDSREGAINRSPTLLEYLNYVLFFLTFVSGPINRFNEFQEDQDSKPRNIPGNEIAAALDRIVVGLLKVFLVSVCAYQVYLNLPLTIASDPPGTGFALRLPDIVQFWFSTDAGDSTLRFSLRYMLRCFAFLVYMYFNFSGYMDIVIGVGRLLGFRIPENFNAPFAANSFMEFWSRWHITLSDWFRTYLFNPLLKTLAANTSSRNAGPYLAVPSFFVTFFIMGIWHGTTPAFVVYGLMLAVGVSVNMAFKTFMQRLLGRKVYNSYSGRTVCKNISRATMIAFFAFSLSCLWLDASEIARLVSVLGMFGVLKIWITASFATYLAVVAWDFAERCIMYRSHLTTDFLFITGIVFLASVWGDVGGFKSLLVDLTGLALPAPFFALMGASLILLSGRLKLITAIQLEDVRPHLRRISMHVLFFFLALLMQTGTVPEFVYKGF
tara:strand:- start:3493 stop:5166 length:1674 start_codon:yes stop_codon:yes gene_type:complete